MGSLDAIMHQVGEQRGSTAERKGFFKSSVKEIDTTGGDALMNYTLPLVAKCEPSSCREVLPIVGDGGAGGKTL